MESIFRSEDVNFCHIIIPYEFSYDVVKSLGNLECVQFLNKNENLPTFNRQFTKNIIWCEEIQRKIRAIKDLIKDENLDQNEDESCGYHDFHDTPSPREFNEFENQISSFLDQISISNKSLCDLHEGFNELVQYLHVLRCTDESFISSNFNKTRLSSQNLSIVTGIITKSKINAFENFLWRACKGNLLFRSFPNLKKLIDPITKEKVSKAVFAVYLQGDQMIAKVKSVCEAFRASLYNIPDSPSEKEQITLGLLTRIKNVELIINKTNDQRKILLHQISRNIRSWQMNICEIKAIFATLNMLQYDTGSKNLMAECWIPKIYVETVMKTLENIRISHGSSHSAILTIVNTNQQHPTFYKSNKFTEGFQNLVDAYAVATYKEINPGLFMIITFPFLFSVMFGDFGHGLFVFFTGLYLVLKEKELVKLKGSEMLSMVYSGRYIILMMGIFSLYSGFLYNDAFSKSFYFFKSGWKLPSHDEIEKIKQGIKDSTLNNKSLIEIDPKISVTSSPYPVGIDPIWMFAKNKIIFINSFKMKTSIILGFFHMLFGIILAAINQRYFIKNVEFYAEFIPQIIFFVSLFGYLVFLIFYKWIFFSAISKHKPSILIVFINMFMNFGKEIPESDFFFAGQSILQPILVVSAVICVPWMLCAKPIYLLIQKRKRNQSSYNRLDTSTNVTNSYDTNISSEVQSQITDINATTNDSHGSNEGIGELAIMQLIHTIEFCLGGISNTASYLRLWALSLAHGQLSELLWSMILRRALSSSSIFSGAIICVVFSIFMIFTISLLVVMEGLSTFLHAIRLHWIEFQNKFYSGGGKPLIVFSLKTIVEKDIY